METLDTEKLKEILDMMAASGAVFIKYGELIIEWPRNDTGKSTAEAIGFEAVGEETAVAEQDKAVKPKPVGYSALFGDKKPQFARPISEGRHA